MILTEWNTEDAIAFARQEEREEGLAQIRLEKLTIARNLLSENSTPEFIQKITGLSLEEINKL